ncbi:glycerol kinase GlpK [Pelagibacterium halotolerans]|uniref:glycerol kinase GlpK n=1 Tax=Pelagibacterium halotolerans TaxID=531813 RepID=UPI0038508F97
MTAYVVAIDQGTTSTRAMVFDGKMHAVATAQTEFTQHFPRSGWVEHDPEEIWKTTVWAVKSALEKAGASVNEVAALGITNQRETVVVWDRTTGKPIHNAIVWQDRRTAPICERLRADGHERVFAEKTGLLVDPYFAGTKVKYLLDEVDGAREKAERGELAFGTIDSFLIWRLTSGKRHVTDATNASRTLLYNIRENAWDDELCAILGVPQSMLPEVLDCADAFGETDPALFGAAVPIRGVAGDQQAAVIGQACFAPGMIKSTYGTGCFALINTGEEFVPSKNRLLTTIAYRLGGTTTYALEGSIFIAGAAVQWLRDELGIIKSAAETGALAGRSDPHQSVYLVPAFVGLGAPWWDPDARGAIFGLTRASGAAEIARAALESVCYQTHDLLEAMHKDWASGDARTVLRVDGGMVASDWTMQCLADILDAPVDRPKMLETTVLGAAWLAGSAAGVWPDQEEFAKGWAVDRQFTPTMDAETRRVKLAGWADAVRRTLS